jgi:hypothetical protein
MDSVDKRPKRKKMDTRFGTCNVRSMYRAGSLRAVVEVISKYKYRVSQKYGYTFKINSVCYCILKSEMVDGI